MHRGRKRARPNFCSSSFKLSGDRTLCFMKNEKCVNCRDIEAPYITNEKCKKHLFEREKILHCTNSQVC